MKKTTYYFIRHAEKERSNPADINPQLTKAGVERAVFWMEFFSAKSLDMIFSTDYARTIQTVTPLLKKTNLHLQRYKPHQLYSKKFITETQGKTVLIVGHQITLPDLMNKIIGKNEYQKIPVDVYGNLYTIILHEDGNMTSFVEQPRKQR